jgi:hypothetical protein
VNHSRFGAAVTSAEAAFDQGLAKIYFMAVIRILLAVFIAIGLAFSPAAPAIAMTSPAAMPGPGCNMGSGMPDHPADHSKMDCCTALCQAPAAAALLPDRGAAGESLCVDGQALTELSAKALLSLSRTAVDPTPRILLS